MATGVTPAGTAWTSYRATLGTGVTGPGYTGWGAANAHIGDPNLPVVVYVHGAAGAYNQFEALSAWAGFRNWLIDNGWGWIEGPSGGTDAWGSPFSESAVGAQFDHVDSILDIGPVVVMGRSAGGPVGDRFYNARRHTDSRFKGVIVNSGVQDLVWAYDYVNPSSGSTWTAAFNAAWGVSSKAEFLAAVAGLNPIDGPASAWDGAKVLQMYGDADTLVPPALNAIPMRAMYAGHPAYDPEPDVRVGGDHSATNGSYLQVAAMTAFLATVTGETPPDPDPPPTHVDTITSISVIGPDGLLYPVSAALL